MENSAITLKKGKLYKKGYTNFDVENLIKGIGKMNLTENILKINYLNKKYDAFHENLMPVVNKNVPLKEMSNKENKKGSLRQFTNETPI